MAEIDELIERIDWKVRKLKSDLEAVKRGSKEKEREIDDLQHQIIDLVSENKKLKEEKQIDKLTNIIIKHQDVKEVKELINVFLRKINRSISIISSKEVDVGGK